MKSEGEVAQASGATIVESTELRDSGMALAVEVERVVYGYGSVVCNWCRVHRAGVHSRTCPVAGIDEARVAYLEAAEREDAWRMARAARRMRRLALQVVREGEFCRGCGRERRNAHMPRCHMAPLDAAAHRVSWRRDRSLVRTPTEVLAGTRWALPRSGEGGRV